MAHDGMPRYKAMPIGHVIATIVEQVCPSMHACMHVIIKAALMCVAYIHAYMPDSPQHWLDGWLGTCHIKHCTHTKLLWAKVMMLQQYDMNP
jgi:hypothetical protein